MADLSTSDRGAAAQAGAAPNPGAAQASWWEDFVDIFYAPSQVYARRAGSGFGIPMLVVTLLITILAFVNSGAMQPIMDAEFARRTAAAMRQNPQLTPEMMAKGRAVGEGVAKYGTIIFVPIGIFLTGLVLWVVGKFVDAKESLGAAIMVAAYAFVPRILENVLKGAQGLLMDPASLNGQFRVSLGLGRFLDPDTTSPVLLALLGRVDVFTIWVTVLLAIGLSVTGRIPRSRAAVAAAVVWAVGALPQLMAALRAS